MFSKGLNGKHIKTKACLGKGQYITKGQILNLTKWKAFADDKIMLVKCFDLSLTEWKTLRENEKMLILQHFLIFTLCFQKAFFKDQYTRNYW